MAALCKGMNHVSGMDKSSQMDRSFPNVNWASVYLSPV